MFYKSGLIFLCDDVLHVRPDTVQCVNYLSVELVFFEDYAMYPPLNVYGNVAFNLRAKGADKEEIDRKVRGEKTHLFDIETGDRIREKN